MQDCARAAARLCGFQIPNNSAGARGHAQRPARVSRPLLAYLPKNSIAAFCLVTLAATVSSCPPARRRACAGVRCVYTSLQRFIAMIPLPFDQRGKRKGLQYGDQCRSTAVQCDVQHHLQQITDEGAQLMGMGSHELQTSIEPVPWSSSESSGCSSSGSDDGKQHITLPAERQREQSCEHLESWSPETPRPIAHHSPHVSQRFGLVNTELDKQLRAGGVKSPARRSFVLEQETFQSGLLSEGYKRKISGLRNQEEDDDTVLQASPTPAQNAWRQATQHGDNNVQSTIAFSQQQSSEARSYFS